MSKKESGDVTLARIVSCIFDAIASFFTAVLYATVVLIIVLIVRDVAEHSVDLVLLVSSAVLMSILIFTRKRIRRNKAVQYAKEASKHT